MKSSCSEPGKQMSRPLDRRVTNTGPNPGNSTHALRLTTTLGCQLVPRHQPRWQNLARHPHLRMTTTPKFVCSISPDILPLHPGADSHSVPDSWRTWEAEAERRRSVAVAAAQLRAMVAAPASPPIAPPLSDDRPPHEQGSAISKAPPAPPPQLGSPPPLPGAGPNPVSELGTGVAPGPPPPPIAAHDSSRAAAGASPVTMPPSSPVSGSAPPSADTITPTPPPDPAFQTTTCLP